MNILIVVGVILTLIGLGQAIDALKEIGAEVHSMQLMSMQTLIAECKAAGWESVLGDHGRGVKCIDPKKVIIVQ